MPLWFVLTSLSVLVLAVAEIAQKIAVTRKDNISAEANNTIVWFLQGFLALAYFLVLARSPLPVFDWILVLRLLVLGSVYFWAGTLFYTSYKTGSASVNSILLSSSIVVSTLLGITFFGESHSIFKFLGSLVVILAIVFLNYDKNVKLSKGNLLALAGAGLYGIAYTLDKGFSIQLSPHLYQVLFSFSIGLSGFLYRGKAIVKDLVKIEKNTLVAASVAALSFFVWNKLNFVSYTVGGEVGRIDSINNFVVFLIIVLEIIVLKDRSNLKKKMVAAIIAFVGVTILALAK